MVEVQFHSRTDRTVLLVELQECLTVHVGLLDLDWQMAT